MNWQALSFGEVAALWVAASALALWLYFRSQRPLRRRVSTLRFWTSAQGAPLLQRRWLREPWALVAQLLLLLLVIAALANPRIGPQDQHRSVVMVLDTSIWSQARPSGETPWIEQIREEAARILNSLPAGDSVLLLRAEPDALPILAATSDRVALNRAIAEVAPSDVVADVPRALELGSAALMGSRNSLLVYIGPGFLDENQAQRLDEFRRRLAVADAGERSPQFIARLIGDLAAPDNRGITALSLRRDAERPDQWTVLAEVKNYSNARANASLNLSVGGTNIRQHSVALAPGEVTKIEDSVIWGKGGLLQAEISPADAVTADNRAFVEIPGSRSVRIAVVGAGSGLEGDLRRVLVANPYVTAEFLPAAAVPSDKPDVAIYVAANPPSNVTTNSIWFSSGGAKGSSSPVRIVNWDSEHPVTRWVRTRDVSVRNPASIAVQPDDIVLASAEGNPAKPLIVARERDGRKMLIFAFDPHNSSLQFESAFPLLMAGSIEWLTHPISDVVESYSTGGIKIPIAASNVYGPAGHAIPFERTESGTSFFASEAGIYRLAAPSGEIDVAANVPTLPEKRWAASEQELAAIEPEPIENSGKDLWPWLVALAAIPLWLEWWLFYSKRGIQKIVAKPQIPLAAEPFGKQVTQNLHSSDAETHHFIN